MINLEEVLEEDLLKSPPDFEMAANHNKAQIIHKSIIEESERCPCCNLSIQTIKYPLATDTNVFSQYGRLYKYFLFVKLYFILLSTYFCIVGIYNLIQNSKGDLCRKSETCKQNLNNHLSAVNRIDPKNFEEDYIFQILNYIAIIVQLVIIRLIYPCINQLVDHVYDYEKMIQSRSFRINLKHFNRDDILNGIVDQCFLYDIDHLENELKSEIKELIQVDNEKSLKDIVRETVNQFNVYLNKDRYLKCTDDVYVTLSDQQEAIKFKEANDYVTVHCSKPSDVVWSQQTSKTRKQNSYMALIANFAWLPILWVQVEKQNYILSNPGKTRNQLHFNTILSLLVALISFIGSKWSIYTFNNFFVSIMQRFQRKRKIGEKAWIDRQFLQFLKNTDITKTIIIFFMYYLLPPLIVAYYIEINDQQKFWRSGGVNEDIILIILTNAVGQMIFSIIDVQYGWQLIKICYYKHFNKQSNLTQFEANQLYLKELDFHQKSIELVIFVGLCTYYGYLLPICYPITLISILIIYWLNKYQLIHYGTRQKIIVNGRLNKFIIIFTFSMQQGSHLVITSANQNFNFHPVFGSLNLAITLVLLYIFFFRRNWIFPERIQTHQTNIDNINSPFHNYLYCQYNPVLNEKNFRNCPKGEERQYILKKGAQCRPTRQEQFYNTLQVKLLREFEQTYISNTQVQPSLY